MTLFQKFDETVSEELIEKLKSLGERNLGDAKGAINAIFYTLLAGLIRRANSDMSTNMLVNQIKKIYDKKLKDFDLETDFSVSSKLQEFVDIGNRNMSQIFPSFKSQLLNLVTTHSSTGKSETSIYSSFVNSLLITFLAEKLNEGTSKDELMNYLKEHRDPLFDRAPESLIEKMIPALGMHDLRNMKMYYVKRKEEKEMAVEGGVENAEVVANTEEYESEDGSAISKRSLLIVAVALLLAIIGYFIYDAREQLFGSDELMESSIIEMPEDQVFLVDSTSHAGDVISSGDAGWLALKELMNTDNLNQSNEIKMESLSFGKDSTEISNPKNPIVDSLVLVFQQNPRFQIQIRGGHENGNSQIALRRAFTLKRLLQSKGVDPIRIDAISDTENLDFLKIRLVSK